MAPTAANCRALFEGTWQCATRTARTRLACLLACFWLMDLDALGPSGRRVDGEDCELRVQQWALPAKSGCPEDTTLTEEDRGST